LASVRFAPKPCQRRDPSDISWIGAVQTAIPRSGVPITASCDPEWYDPRVKIPCADLLAIRELRSHRVRSTKFVGRQATHKL
jgi:hypothetical protein